MAIKINQNRKGRKVYDRMTHQERIDEIDRLEKLLHENIEIEKKVKENSPFWYYEPVVGDVSPERRKFLEKYLHQDDIPQKLDSAVDFHCSQASIRGASGGNQSSKTTSCTIEALIKATGALPYVFDPSKPKYFKHRLPEKRTKRTGPQHVRVIGEDFQNGILRNLIPTFRKWTPVEYLRNRKWTDSYSAGEQVLRLYAPNSNRIVGTVEFMSNKQDLGTFQGPPRHMMVYDEEPNRDVYKENLMRFTTADSMDIVFGMTPTKGLSWTYDLYTKGIDETGNKIDWFQIASVCNPHANLMVLAEILDEIESYDELKMRLLGEFISLSGLVYGKAFQPRVHVIPPFETACTCYGQANHEDGCPYLKYLCFLGVDAHMVKDSTAALCAIDSEDNFIVDRCYKRAVNTEEFKADMHTDKYLKKRRLDFAVFDPSNDSSITVFNGLNIYKLCTSGQNRIPRARKADKYHGSIAAGVDTIKRRLLINDKSKKPSIFIMDRPENQLLIKSMKTLQRDSFGNEEIKGQKDRIMEGVHDHHACMRYILQTKLRWKPYIRQEVVSMVPDEEMVLL